VDGHFLHDLAQEVALLVGRTLIEVPLEDAEESGYLLQVDDLAALIVALLA